MNQMSSRGDATSLLTMGYMRVLEEDELQDILTWVDQVPVSREKKNLSRDFSDGVTMAEIIKYFLPKYVELHHFSPANNTKTKEQNWFHLNRVLSKMGLELDTEVVHALAQCRPWVVENVLIAIRDKIEVIIEPMSPGRANTNVIYRAGDHNCPPKRSDMIHQTYDKRQQETIEKQELTIELLNEKVRKLEHVIRMKDSRIADLAERLRKADYDRNYESSAAVAQTDVGKKTGSSVNNKGSIISRRK